MRALFVASIKSVALAAALSACATSAVVKSSEVNGPRTALARETCSKVMGLDPGRAQFRGCAETLETELVRLDEARRLTLAQGRCEQQGRKEGTPDFALCVLSAQRAQITPITAPSASASLPLERVSFFRMDRPTRLVHEKFSCARLGIDPGTPEFSRCVLSLSDVFFGFDNPR